MKVIRASKAGFCMGVSLALKKLEDALNNSRTRLKADGAICTLGPIIHNPQVLESFKRQGVRCLLDSSEASENDHVLIRAHGIPLEVERELRERCAHVEDATCPKVKKAQLAIARATSGGAVLLLFGEAEHPEVRGLVSYAKSGAIVIGSLEEVEALAIDNGRPYVLASQTTQDREAFERIAAKLSRIPKLCILSTICDATRQRQEEALTLAREVNAMVVAGGRDSGNTRRLAALAAQTGIRAFHVETPDELEPEDFAEVEVVGLTAGASTPKAIIDAMEQRLLSIGNK